MGLKHVTDAKMIKAKKADHAKLSELERRVKTLEDIVVNKKL